ncbi:MAG TPA: hypothetical protein VL306_02665 [Methylomirabilota bacterium]|jgi:hypothetical protein|nr:hypothetical protein [Methylomirabilota bacterium]
MAFTQDEKVQEWFLLLGDKLAPVKKIWWYILLIAFVFAIPAYYVLKSVFVVSLIAGYSGPALIYTAPIKEPLQVLDDKQIFSYADNNYAGYIKIKNVNLEWGVADQEYKIDFKTFGGTVVNTLDRTTYILPGSEKLIVIPRFQADKKPDEMIVTLGQTHFVHTPGITINTDKQRTILQNSPNGATVSSAFINMSPFTIHKVDLGVAVFNTQNKIVGVNYTNINDVKASETRTFQVAWPEQILGGVRSEVYPEIDIFDRNILSAPAGVSPFDSSSQ